MLYEEKLTDLVKERRGVFTELPKAVPAGNVDVSGGGRWKIWQDAGTKIDAPILGNGDLLAAFSGPAEYPQFWFTTNDFWQMESAANWEFFHDNSVAKAAPAVSLGSPKPVGRLVFDIPKLCGAACRVEQEYLTAVTTAKYDLKDGGHLEIASFVAAEENELVIQFRADREMELLYEFRFPDELGKGCDKGVDFEGTGEDEEIRNEMFVGLVGGKPLQVKRQKGSLVCGYREFSDHVDVSTRVGFAGDFVTAAPGKTASESQKKRTCPNLCLKPGRTETFVLSVRSWAKVSRPYEYAVSRTRWMTPEDVKEIREQHLAWWKEYWSVSGIEMGDPVIENHYYLSQYMMGSVSRDPEYPPNILGISTFDRQAWNGNYKINYNHQSPYLGLLSAGHFEQSDPHDAPYLAMLDITREMSLRLLHHRGAYYPLGLGPAGMVSEALLLYMKSPAVHGALNMIMRYELTLDREYGRKVYPFLLSVADFWEQDLVCRDGIYHVVGDGMHERIVRDVRANGLPEDPVNTLGYLKTFFEFMPRLSEDLGMDEERREGWKDIAEHLTPYPKGTIREITDNPTLWKEAEADLKDLLPEEWLDRPIYYDEGKGGKWSFHFPGNIMHIYPGNAVTPESPEEERQTAWNTVHVHALVEDALAGYHSGDGREAHQKKAGAWNADNLSCLFFPAAVRAGYDPEKILQEMRERILYRGIPNGFYEGNPHGIENLSTVPNTLQEMMLQSYDHIVRLFPNWPKERHPDAAFYGLWAYGAFQVSARLREGIVEEAEIISHKGALCRVENPWPEEAVQIRLVGCDWIGELRGKILELPKMPGTFVLTRAGYDAKE